MSAAIVRAVRRTSLAAWQAINESGLLSRRRTQVYNWLYENGPATQNEIHHLGFPDTKTDSIKPRVSELVRLGVVAEAGERVCGVTGYRVMAWDVTDELPKGSVKSSDGWRTVGAWKTWPEVVRGTLGSAGDWDTQDVRIVTLGRGSGRVWKVQVKA